MAFLDLTKANIAYKLALGKIHTNNNRESFNEPESTLSISMGQYAWGQKFHASNPADASNVGIVSSLLTLALVAVSGTDGTGIPSAFYCKLNGAVPADLVGKINPRTGLAYVANDRVGNIIPASAGAVYRAKLFNGAVETTPLDASDWFIDCFAGVVSQETDVPANMINYTAAGTVQAYVYIGKSVADAISSVVATVTSTPVITFYDKKVNGNGIVGIINGVNDTFTIQAIPDTFSEHVYLNGLLLQAGVTNDYVLTGASLVLSSNFIPAVGDVLLISYRVTTVV